MKTRFASDYKYLGFGKYRTTHIVELDNHETKKTYSYSINKTLKKRDIIITIAIIISIAIIILVSVVQVSIISNSN